MQFDQEEWNWKNAERVGIVAENLHSLIELSNVPFQSRKKVANETLAHLLNVLGRIGFPSPSDVPDVDAYKADGPASYRIANTPLQIARVEDGSRVGEFLFNEQTVQVAPRFDRGIDNLPLRSTLQIGRCTELMPQLTGPFFPAIQLSAIPESLKIPVLGTPLWKILVVLLISVAAASTLLTLYSVMMRYKPASRALALFLLLLRPLAVLIVISILLKDFDRQVIITGEFSRITTFIYLLTFYATAAWLFWLAALEFFELVVVYPRFPDQSLDADLMRLVARIVGGLGAILVIAYGANEIGVPVISILTGLGIGGIAFALAIRPTLENLIGGFIFYMGQPVKIGDFCSFGESSGTIEAIGMRSTQIRSLDRTLISVPSSQFADMLLANWARCDQMLIDQTIGLRYETETDQLRYALAKIREMLHSHPRIDPETIRVRFSGYGSSTLDVSVRVYAKTREWNDFYAIKEDILLRIGDIAKQSGTGFAFPSRTLYMAEDAGLNEKLGERALDEVKTWRHSRRLPFPRFAASKLEELAGKLDYPPRGSPEFNATDEELAIGSEPLSADVPLEEDEESENEKTGPSES